MLGNFLANKSCKTYSLFSIFPQFSHKAHNKSVELKYFECSGSVTGPAWNGIGANVHIPNKGETMFIAVLSTSRTCLIWEAFYISGEICVLKYLILEKLFLTKI